MFPLQRTSTDLWRNYEGRKIVKKSMTQVTRWFLSRDSVKRNMFTYSTLWRPSGRRLHSTTLKRSRKIKLQYHTSSLYYNHVCEESLEIWSLSHPYTMISINTYSREGEIIRTQKHNASTHTRKQSQEHEYKITQ
jgi:hypothetical protein